MSRVSNRDMGHHPIEDCGALLCSVIRPMPTPSWIALFTTLTAFNSPEKACEKRTLAIKLLTQTQTPEPITTSVKAAAHDRAKYLLTIV
jgi:hypothetical protein